MPSFDLVDRPWIGCLKRDGEAVELSIRQVLARAHDLRSISDPSPLVTVALHRLLLAILHRNFGPASTEAWYGLRQRGYWDMTVLDAYLDKWRHRFDLFDERRPFYQLGTLDGEGARSSAGLIHELASGANPTLFDHTLDDQPPALAPARAARCLVGFQCFATGGLITFAKGEDAATHKSADAAPLFKAAVVLCTGNSLFETLMLNMVRYDPSAEMPFVTTGEDRPVWERDSVTAAQDRYPTGYLDLLTWQSRRVRLLPDDLPDGATTVRSIVAMKGFQFPSEYTLRQKEPMICFRSVGEGKKEEKRILGFSEDRAIWRDSMALVGFGKSEGYATLRSLGQLKAEGYLDEHRVIPIDVLGMCANKSKLILWRHERLPLPLTYLGGGPEATELLARLDFALGLGESVKTSLRSAGWRFASRMVAPQTDVDRNPPKREVVEPVYNSLNLEQPYWAALELPFRQLLIDMPNDRHVTADGSVEFGLRVIPTWWRAVRGRARDALLEALTGLESSPRSFHGVAEAETILWRRLDDIGDRSFNRMQEVNTA